MQPIRTARRGFLAMMGAAAAASAMPRAAFGEAPDGRSPDAQSPDLSFGFQNTSWGTIGMIAEARDLFAKTGARIGAHKFSSGKATRDAMIGGRIDIGVIGATPFVLGAAKGELVAIGVALYGTKTLSVVGSAKAELKSMADLKEKLVGSQAGSATDAVFRSKIMPKFGLSSADVQIVNVPFQNHLEALASGSIDAFAGVEPFPSIAEVEKVGRVLVDYSDFDLQPIILAANRSVVEAKREAVVAFLRAWLAGVKVFKDEPEAATEIVLKHFKDQGFAVTPEVIKLMLTKLDVNPAFSPALVDYLKAETADLIRQKKIETAPDWDKLLYRDLLQEATV